jgi:hypothetical protein
MAMALEWSLDEFRNGIACRGQACFSIGRQRGACQRNIAWVSLEHVEDPPMQQSRLDYNESIRRLQELGWLEQYESPPLPDGVSQPEDEQPLGLSFFRTFVGDSADLADVTMPRTLFWPF